MEEATFRFYEKVDGKKIPRPLEEIGPSLFSSTQMRDAFLTFARSLPKCENAYDISYTDSAVIIDGNGVSQSFPRK